MFGETWKTLGRLALLFHKPRSMSMCVHGTSVGPLFTLGGVGRWVEWLILGKGPGGGSIWVDVDNCRSSPWRIR